MGLDIEALFPQTGVVQRFTEDKSVLCSIACMQDTMQHNMQLF